MRDRFSAYLAQSNKNFSIKFPATLACAVTLWYLSHSWFCLVPLGFAVIEAMAKLYEIRQRKKSD